MRHFMRTCQVFVLLGACGLASFGAVGQDFARLDVATTKLASAFAPVFDFDADGCFPSAGISRNGQINRGLDNSGDLGGKCRPDNFMDLSNALHRYECAYNKDDKSEYCGHFYALYFRKDQAVAGPIDAGGHRHDWEHVAIWTKDGEMTHASVSAHGKMARKAVGDSDLYRNEYGQVMVVYHKDNALTHAFRFAKSASEAPENPYGRFVTPAIATWYEMTGDNQSNGDMRKRLDNADYGSANLPVSQRNFFRNLNKFKPNGYPDFATQDESVEYNPEDSARGCQYSELFSEEQGGEMCPSGFLVSGMNCSGSYCDNKQLLCCPADAVGKTLTDHMTTTTYFSEEPINSFHDLRDAIVGVNCDGRDCDNVSLKLQEVEGGASAGRWSPEFSDEHHGEYICRNGSELSYAAGLKCTGKYCDNISLYCVSSN